MAIATMTTTENTARKRVVAPLTPDTLVTLSFTPKQLEELAEALASHETSWCIVDNTPKGRSLIHWAKKDFIVDGRYIIVGGKAKAHYREGGKVHTFNKHSRILALRERIAQALKL